MYYQQNIQELVNKVIETEQQLQLKNKKGGQRGKVDKMFKLLLKKMERNQRSYKRK